MGHHRADTRASRGRGSVTPGTPSYPSTSIGKRAAGRRVAEKPSRRSVTPVAVPAPEAVLVEHVVPQAPTPATSAGSAGRRCAPRKSLFRGLPSAPILLGVAALAISVGGAVSAADPALVGATGPGAGAGTKLMQASALSGA